MPLLKPRMQSWQELFALDDVIIVGLTSIRRATVRLLHMKSEDPLKMHAALSHVIALVAQKRDSLSTRQRTVLEELSMTTESISQFVTDPLPFARLLGLELVAVTPDRVEAVLQVREELCTRPAVLHGGAVMALADTLGAIATVANVAEGTTTTTIESKTNFFAAIPLGDTARAECTPLHRGRTTMVWQTRVMRSDGRVAALVIQTQLVLPATR
jgi:uncharacterized protein (TIGR00369 family)